MKRTKWDDLHEGLGALCYLFIGILGLIAAMVRAVIMAGKAMLK